MFSRSLDFQAYLIVANIFYHSWQEFSPHLRLITVQTRRWTRKHFSAVQCASSWCLLRDSPHKILDQSHVSKPVDWGFALFVSRKALKMNHEDQRICMEMTCMMHWCMLLDLNATKCSYHRRIHPDSRHCHCDRSRRLLLLWSLLMLLLMFIVCLCGKIRMNCGRL